MKQILIFIVLIFFSSILCAENIALTDAQALEIGKKLWQNECDGTVDGLTSWNDGEEFASLGIGHFIWYVQGMEGPFEESFPKLLDFLKAQNVSIPEWMQGKCPWKTKKEFEKDFHSPHMQELRDLLKNTVALQARFAANRLEASLSKMLEQAPAEDREKIQKNFYLVASAHTGPYALMDYVNFKGEGTKDTERYKGEGWGLLQVLQNMKATSSGQAAVDEFVISADKMLTRRVKNSPSARGEIRWLPGWKSRLQTYRK